MPSKLAIHSLVAVDGRMELVHKLPLEYALAMFVNVKLLSKVAIDNRSKSID